jgi:hypothetical protein
VQAVLVVEGHADMPLLEKVRDAFGVDEATHRGCIEQVTGMVDALDAELVVNVSRLRVQLPDHLRAAVEDDFALLAMVEAVTSEPTAEVSSKKALAKRLCKAISESNGGTDLDLIRDLLEQGADPNLAPSRKGSAMLLAAELNHPPLTTLLVGKGGDPTLERNSRRASSKTIVQGSSGVFETVPIGLQDGAAVFPDEFILPLPQGPEGVTNNTVSIEIWRTNTGPVSPAAPEAGLAPTADVAGGASPTTSQGGGKRKRVRRRFFRGRAPTDGSMGDADGDVKWSPAPSSRVVIEKNGIMIEFVGVVRFEIEPLVVGKPQVLKLVSGDSAKAGKAGKAGKPQPNPGVCVDVTVRLSSDLSEISRRRRKQHQDVLEKVLKSATKAFCREQDETSQPWTGNEMYHFLPIIRLHARWARMPRRQSALDTFCAVVEVSGRMPVSATVVLPILQELRDSSPQGFAEVDDESQQRLVAALESVATSYFHVASHPHKCVERSDAGVTELSACVNVLKLVYGIDEWQQATIGMGQTVDDDPDNPVPFDAPILAEAAGLVDKQLQASKIDYRSIKSALLESHSLETFECHKRTIQQLCAEGAAELDKRRHEASMAENGDAKTDPGRDETVASRAREIIEGSSKKLLTYPTVKAQLVKEFGARVVADHRRVISAEIVMSMGRRLSMMQQLRSMDDNQPPPTRVLALELTTALENFVKECYENIRHRVKASLGSEFEGHELVMLVRTMDALVVELEGIKTWFHAAYSEVRGMVLTHSFSMWYDKLVSADLRSVLSMWEDRCTENNFPFLFFNLLFSARRLWDWMEVNLGELSIADFRLFQHREWFYPFVTAWLIQSKAAALQMVERAINNDKWRPVSDNRLVSESSLDITRIVYEVVSMYQKIDWPDREANEEQLFQLLADAVCACFRTYSITIKEYCAKQGVHVGGTQKGGVVGDGVDDADQAGGDFFLDDGICIILNDLEFVSVRLNGLHRFMQVAEVAESHRRRAEREIQGHRGNIKPHGAVRLFHNANSHIQKCIISLGGLIADRLCVRLERDLSIIFDRFRTPVVPDGGEIAAVRKAELEDAIDGLVSEQDDLRVALPKSSSQSTRRTLFECTPLYQAVQTRKAIKAREKQLKPDGYVYINFCILASKMEYLETRNKVVECIWQSLMVVLGTVLSRQACDERSTADQLLGLTMDINAQLIDFLVADGDGVPQDELERLSATYLTPICTCFRMNSEELVRYLLMNAAFAHSGSISDHVRKARSIDVEPTPDDRTAQFSMMDEYSLNVQADVTSAAVDAVRLTAGELQPQNLGCLRLRLLRFGDDARGKSLRVNLVGGMKLPRNNVYVKAKVISSSGGDSAVKFKSQVAHGNYNPTFDEGFTVPNCTDGIAVEIRLYEETSGVLSSILSPFKTKKGVPCLGEVLLDLTAASELEGEVVLDFQLCPVEYTGQLQQAQELLRNRTDKIAKAYTLDHIQDDCAQR